MEKSVQRRIQKWEKELTMFLSSRNLFIVTGNVYDVIPIKTATSNQNEEKLILKRLEGAISSILIEENYEYVVSYQPAEKFRLLVGDEKSALSIEGLRDFLRVNENQDSQEQTAITLQDELEIIIGGLERLIDTIYYQKPKPVKFGFIINYAAVLQRLTDERILNFFLYKIFTLSQIGIPVIYEENGVRFKKFCPIIFVCERLSDLPDWFTDQRKNPRLWILDIPIPDNDVRKIIIDSIVKPRVVDELNKLALENSEINVEQKAKEIMSAFLDQTTGLKALEIPAILDTAQKNSIPFTQIVEVARLYKLGVMENPWAKLQKEKIERIEQELKKRVMGQDRAVKKAASIIRRSFFNLSGSQFSKFSQKPKGVLFLAGPTGVGKTELAKSLAEFLFGSETAYIRFDMSEFQHEHSDQRLLGAPPGYVGYSEGGELTNAIRQRPFSVILFDEIEKAHHRILDIFLQILDDGRVTSGRGETVYFSEAIIVFTSNLGVYEMRGDQKIQRVNQDMPYEEIETKIKEAIEEFFKFRIGRPEILNRIGTNIVVFDFIRPEIAVQIVNKMLKNIIDKVEMEHKMHLNFSNEVRDAIVKECTKDLSMGGRGIGNKLEELITNPLAEFLTYKWPKEGDNIEVTGLVFNEDLKIWELEAQIK